MRLSRKPLWLFGGASAATAGIAAAVIATAVAAPSDESPAPATDSPRISGDSSPNLHELQAKLNAISSPAGRSAAPNVRAVQGNGPDPVLYDRGAVGAGMEWSQSFEVTSFALMSPASGSATVIQTIDGTPLGPGKIPFVREAGDWRIDRAWLCALTTPKGVPAQDGCPSM